MKEKTRAGSIYKNNYIYITILWESRIKVFTNIGPIPAAIIFKLVLHLKISQMVINLYCLNFECDSQHILMSYNFQICDYFLLLACPDKGVTYVENTGHQWQQDVGEDDTLWYSRFYSRISLVEVGLFFRSGHCSPNIAVYCVEVEETKHYDDNYGDN